jgi:hypothetical protein
MILDEIYERAVARGVDSIKEEIDAMRAKYDGDPEGFKNAAARFLSDLITNMMVVRQATRVGK